MSEKKKTSTVLLGVGGGIAAYKSVDVASKLRQIGADVHVVMTDSAMEFITPLTFGAITGNSVLSSMFNKSTEGKFDDLYPHLYPATESDIFILAPATANTIAKLAQGKGDDLISTCALSLPQHCRRYYCPAMNVEMWENETVQANCMTLEERGWTRIGPETGHLACGTTGYGRMTQPDEIVDTVKSAIEVANKLKDKKLLILSGPTREHLDPVRFFGNPSSGRMGKALAEEAAAMGAQVQFITGPVANEQIPRSPRIRVHQVTGATEMLAQADANYDEADIVIYAAAVADYMPESFNEIKKAKEKEGLQLFLKPTPDIAATLNNSRKKNQLCIGFALQSHNGFEEAQHKMDSKKFDGIVLNHLDALGGDTGTYDFRTAHQADQNFEHWGTLSKRACARKILLATTGLLAELPSPTV